MKQWMWDVYVRVIIDLSYAVIFLQQKTCDHQIKTQIELNCINYILQYIFAINTNPQNPRRALKTESFNKDIAHTEEAFNNMDFDDFIHNWSKVRVSTGQAARIKTLLSYRMLCRNSSLDCTSCK